MSERRIKRAMVDLDFLFTILTEGNRVSFECASGIPQGAKARGEYFDYAMCSFFIVVEHESFDPVAEGELIPCIYPQIRFLEDTDEKRTT